LWFGEFWSRNMSKCQCDHKQQGNDDTTHLILIGGILSPNDIFPGTR
jgi:hypothetical protein